MKQLYLLLSLPLLALTLSAEKKNLADKEYIQEYLTHEAPWALTHGAKGEDLGGGMLYYALAYIKKAKLCVCLGSGGGFVPRVMRQAQRDLGLDQARTILVDGNIGPYGRPLWLSENSFFRKEFPDIEIIIDLTHQVALNQGKEWRIDYLHIDADRSFKGAYQDLIDYLPLMTPGGVITLHDTRNGLPCAQLVNVVREMGYNVVDFKELGSGVALIQMP